MSSKKNFCFVCLVVVFCLSGAGYGDYTARAFIEVLPYADSDPFELSTPEISESMQGVFRNSLAELLRSQGMMEDLLRRDEIKNTRWYNGFAEQPAERRKAAVNDLQKQFCVTPIPQSNLIEVSMICSDKTEPALIVNEMIGLFVRQQSGIARERLAAKLSQLQERRRLIRIELDAAERSLEEVRSRYGFADLEGSSGYSLVLKRITRLETLRDELLLEIAGIKAMAGQSQEKALAPSEELLRLEAKLAESKKMLEDASKEKQDYDMARVQYKQRAVIRDERQAVLNEVLRVIEKLRVMYDDPDVGKVRVVQPAREGL